MKTKEYIQGGIRSSLVSLFLVLAICSTGIGIAGAVPVLSITPSTTNVDVGDNFSVFIEVNPAGYTLQQAHTDFIFDSSKVSILEVVDGETFGTYIPGTLGDGIIDDITGVDAGVSSTGNLVEIRMQADNSGTVTIGLSDAGVGTATETLTPDINNGTVTISGAPAPVLSITPSTTNVDVGDNFSVFIEVNPAGYTLQQAHTDFIFDSSKVSILEVVDGETFGTYIPGTLGDGIIDDITGVDAGVSSTGNLVEIRMQADNSGTVTIGLSDAGVGTDTGTLTPDINNGTVIIGAAAAPTCTVSVTNTTIVPPQTTGITVAFSEKVQYTLNIETSDGAVVYDWTGERSTDRTVTWNGSYEVNGTQVLDGTYKVNLTVTNTTTGLTGYNRTETIVVSPGVNQPPTAVIASPTASGTYHEETPVSFHATGSSDLDGTIETYTWDFGDGDIGTGETTTHTYATTGSMTVTLTVTDDGGANDTETVTINVLAAGAVVVHLYTGWNLIAIPVNDPTADTAAELASRITGCKEVVMWDATEAKYVPYTNVGTWTGTNFAITGGMGIFVNVEDATTVVFTGDAWS